ncbi:hypothetical protein KR067_007948 [Drosophila pandora]|nr:hypothetical protein KR067_007948 [Drosophila pandora]
MADKGGYNPYDNREVEHPLTNFGAFISLIKCVVGTGILALPMAFYYAGIIFGIFMLVTITFLLIHGMQLLIICMIECSRRLQIGYCTFPDTMKYALGQGPQCCKCLAKAGAIICDAVLISSHYGVCVVYIVFVSLNLKEIMDYNVVELHQTIYIAIIGALLIFPFMITRLKWLVPFNVLASVLEYLAFACMIYYIFQDLPSITERAIFFGKIEKMPLFFGIVLFSISSVGVMLAIEAKMEHPEKYIGWFGILDIAAVCVVLSYIFFGVMGYWKYGDEIKPALSINLPTKEPLAQFAQGCIMCAIFFTYSLCGYVVINIIMSHYWNKNGDLKHALIKELILRFVFVIVSTINAIAFSNLGPLLSLVGAFSISLLNLIFPAMIEICLLYPPEFNYGRMKWKLIKDIILIIVGTMILFHGTYVAISDMIESWIYQTTEAPSTEDTTEADDSPPEAPMEENQPPPALRFFADYISL